MKKMKQIVLFMCMVGRVLSLDPILIRGNKMFNSDSGERFYMKGITYGYAVDDEYYDKYGRTVIDKHMASLKGHYNTIRVYNINPDMSYAKFMRHMDDIGVYVLVSAAPANDPYFGSYRYATMRKDLGANGVIKTDSDGKKSLDLTESCYPALLLEYGKRIAKMFAKYDNTLGIIVSNEIMQKDLVAAACVKQYVADIKNWMRINGSKMRLLPLAFAIADSAHGSLQDADKYGATKLQGLLCDDVMKNGLTYESIDIFLINSYRWCPDSTFATAYERMVKWTSGAPVVVAMGEFGCKNEKGVPRLFNMVPYLFGSNSGNQKMHEIFSGGTAYSYGNANQGDASLFPLFLGGSQQMTGKPSDEKTVDFDNLVEQYTDIRPPVENAGWDDDDKCRWVPPVKTSVSAMVDTDSWFTSCSKVFVKSGDTWKTTSRNGAVCSSNGNPCDVSVTSKVGTTEYDLCGFVDKISGGAACTVNSDCGLHGTCKNKICECIGCYSGPSCNVYDSAKCAEISSWEGAAPFVFGAVGVGVTIMCVVFATLYSKSKAHAKGRQLVSSSCIVNNSYIETQRIGNQINTQAQNGVVSM